MSLGVLCTGAKHLGGALTGAAQLDGRHPAKRKVVDSFPGQGTCLGCGFRPQLGC